MIRLADGYGSGSNRIGCTGLKSAVLPPMPNAMVTTATSVKMGFLINVRQPKRRSCQRVFILAPSTTSIGPTSPIGPIRTAALVGTTCVGGCPGPPTLDETALPANAGGSDYSYLSATSGSTFVARRAGM